MVEFPLGNGQLVGNKSRHHKAGRFSGACGNDRGNGMGPQTLGICVSKVYSS